MMINLRWNSIVNSFFCLHEPFFFCVQMKNVYKSLNPRWKWSGPLAAFFKQISSCMAVGERFPRIQVRVRCLGFAPHAVEAHSA